LGKEVILISGVKISALDCKMAEGDIQNPVSYGIFLEVQ
jgi:hypothetical protein